MNADADEASLDGARWVLTPAGTALVGVDPLEPVRQAAEALVQVERRFAVACAAALRLGVPEEQVRAVFPDGRPLPEAAHWEPPDSERMD